MSSGFESTGQLIEPVGRGFRINAANSGGESDGCGGGGHHHYAGQYKRPAGG